MDQEQQEWAQTLRNMNRDRWLSANHGKTAFDYDTMTAKQDQEYKKRAEDRTLSQAQDAVFLFILVIVASLSVLPALIAWVLTCFFCY